MSLDFTLDPALAYLNHGSFGACPAAILEHQRRLRAELERSPIETLYRRFEARHDEVLARVAAFVGARAADLAFVPNASAGVNTVLRSFPFEVGDRILVTDHAYAACKNAVDFVAARHGLEVDVAAVPFPLAGPEPILEAVERSVRSRTRLALLDHVTSPTALIFPIEALVSSLEARGIACLVDGAHALGMLPLALDALGASFYTANAHKWLCAPKGAAILHVRADRQPEVRPLVISHGASSPRTDKSRFELEMLWQGTDDPTAWWCVPEVIALVERELGWARLMERNRALARAARDLLIDALRIAAPCPDSMLGSMAAVPLPETDPRALHLRLFEVHGVEVPVHRFGGRVLLRVSAQLYNRIEDYERLVRALAAEGLLR